MHRAFPLLTAVCVAALSLGALSLAAEPAPESATPGGRHEAATLLVAFEPGTPPAARAEAHLRSRAAVVHSLAWRDVDVVRLAPGASVRATAADYLRSGGVRSAAPNWEYAATEGPDDPSFAAQWGLHNRGQEVPGAGRPGTADVDIDAPEGWASAYGSGRFPDAGGAVIGVIDTGVDAGHPDLAGKVVACASATSGSGQVTEGACADDTGHGTHVAGTIGARAGDSVGVAGVAPDAQLAVFKALASGGRGYDADIVAGIRWLRTVARARVINMSFGDAARSEVLEAELADAAAAGVLLVASAGNTGDATGSYPAYHPDVLSVSAVDHDGRRPAFSVCNDDVEVAAPGVHIVSTAPRGGYSRASGTSMATAHVSGVAGVLLSRRGLSAEQARAALVNGTVGGAGCSAVRLLNFAGAMRASTVSTGRRRSASATPSAAGSPTPASLVPTLWPVPPLGGSPSPSPTRAGGS